MNTMNHHMQVCKCNLDARLNPAKINISLWVFTIVAGDTYTQTSPPRSLSILAVHTLPSLLCVDLLHFIFLISPLFCSPHAGPEIEQQGSSHTHSGGDSELDGSGRPADNGLHSKWPLAMVITISDHLCSHLPLPGHGPFSVCRVCCDGCVDTSQHWIGLGDQEVPGVPVNILL